MKTIVIVLAFAFIGCTSDPACTGDTCQCHDGEPCVHDCAPGSECRVQCVAGETCDVTCDPSQPCHVQCATSSDCHVACNGGPDCEVMLPPTAGTVTSCDESSCIAMCGTGDATYGNGMATCP